MSENLCWWEHLQTYYSTIRRTTSNYCWHSYREYWRNLRDKNGLQAFFHLRCMKCKICFIFSSLISSNTSSTMKIIKVWHYSFVILGLIRRVFKLTTQNDPHHEGLMNQQWTLSADGSKMGVILKTIWSAWQIIISHRENLLILIHHSLINSGHG